MGTVLLVLFLSAYALLAGVVGSGRILQASALWQLVFFVGAGVIWVLPAGLLIRWMQKPDGA